MVIEFLAGAGAGCFALLAFFRWLWGRQNDALIQRGPCAHCRRMLDASENGKDHEHWRVCPKHPARAEVERLKVALRQIADLADASEPLSVVACRWATEALDADATLQEAR